MGSANFLVGSVGQAKIDAEGSKKAPKAKTNRRRQKISTHTHKFTCVSAFGDFFRLRRFFPPSAPMYLSMARRLAHGYNGSHGPWLQWVPWPMVTMGPMAHGYNGSHGPWLQWAPWPMVTMGPMAHGYNGPHGPTYRPRMSEPAHLNQQETPK